VDGEVDEYFIVRLHELDEFLQGKPVMPDGKEAFGAIPKN
jgi:hypothetical protein